MAILMSQGFLQLLLTELRYRVTYPVWYFLGKVGGGPSICSCLCIQLSKWTLKCVFCYVPSVGWIFQFVKLCPCWNVDPQAGIFPHSLLWSVLLLQLCGEGGVWWWSSSSVLVIFVASLKNWLHKLSPWMPRIELLQCRGGTVWKFPQYCKFRISYLSCAVRRH